MSTIASHSPLNISDTVSDRGLVPKGPPIGNFIKWSRDRRRRDPLKGQTRDPIGLRLERNISITAGDAI